MACFSGRKSASSGEGSGGGGGASSADAVRDRVRAPTSRTGRSAVASQRPWLRELRWPAIMLSVYPTVPTRLPSLLL